MPPPYLVADRFLVSGARVRDLATGDAVLLRVSRRAGTERDWAERCARLLTVSHPWLAPCLDYGVLDDERTFEAYGLVAASTSASPRTMVAAVSRCLTRHGLAERVECMSVEGGRVVVASGRAEPPDGREPCRADLPRGRLLHPPPQLLLAAERLHAESRLGLSWCDIDADAATRPALTRFLPREARLAGWTPVRLALIARGDLAPIVADAVEGRHLVVLDDDRGDEPRARADAVSALTRLASRLSRPSLVLRIGTAGDDVPRACARSPGARPRSVVRLREGEGHDWLVARETSMALADGARDDDPRPRPRLVSRGLVPPTLDAVRTLVARGRHAAAERALRQAATAAGRRDAAPDAAGLWAAVARLLLGRGRVALTVAAIDEAEGWLARSPDVALSVECALLRGHAEVLRLNAGPAEAAMRSAAAAAAVSPDAAAWRQAAVRAAEGLWWLGHVDEARALLQSLADQVDAMSAADAVDTLAVLARLALCDGSAAAAGVLVSRAVDRAGAGPASVRRAALLARVRWMATVGDCAGLAEWGSRLLADARRDRAHLAATEVRLLTAEGALRAREPSRARALARGLAHLAEGPTPPLVAARARLVLAALASRAEGEKLRDALVRRGFGAFGSPDAAGLALPPLDQGRSSTMLDAVLEMLRVCQDEEPRTALSRVAEVLRVRCSAAVVAVMTGGAAPLTIAVPATGRQPVLAARRALDAGMVIDLHHAECGQEAAAPMRHAGVLVGAVGCRWVQAPPGSASDVRRLLETAAAAAGPCARAIDEQAHPPTVAPSACDLVGSSASMEAVRRAIARAADAPFSVLLEGESGSGKELAARAIHRSGPRRHRPFCVVNGAALPDDLLEAELFGHSRGAFTGALAERRGLFEEADGGELFLDEVGELSLRAQAKLLRVVQEGEVRRLGEAHPRHVDVRLVAATNRTLETEVAAGRFRGDLFYRLAVVRIRLPPLRERQDDVPELAAALWLRAASRVGSRAVLSAATLAALARYDWPGNVRELQNVLAALAVSAPRRGVIGPALLPSAIAGAADAVAPVRLEEARRHFEARFVRAALARAGGHRGRAAADLGVTRQGLAKLIERLGIETAPQE